MKNFEIILFSSIMLCSCTNKSNDKQSEAVPSADNKLENKTDATAVAQKRISRDQAIKLAMKQFDAYLPTILAADSDAAIDLQVPNVGDFTGDGVEDVAIYFNLVPKDGGNAMLKQGLTLYKNTGTNVEVMAGYDPDYLFAFDTIRDGKIHIKKLQYTENDGRCCPSIQIPHTLTIKGNVAY